MYDRAERAMDDWRSALRRQRPPTQPRNRTTPVSNAIVHRTSYIGNGLDLHDVGLVGLAEVIERTGVAIGEILEAILGAPLVVLGDQLLVLHLAQIVERLAAYVAQRDLRLLDLLAHHLHQALA